MSERTTLAPVGAAVLLALLTAIRATAAPVTSADPAGLCNGQVPCFTTISAAVANAGPPPATVFVFPGTYAESVALASMGSSIGGGPGEIAVISVDAAGQPAPGAVVDPAAPGGPGTGSALQAVSYPGAVTIDGLVLRSPDNHGLLLAIGSGPVHLRNLVSSGNPDGHGIFAVLNAASPAEVTAEALRADGNSQTGVILGGARVVATDVSASNNGIRGINLGGNEVVGTNLTAEGNGDQGVAVSLVNALAAVTLDGVTVRGNDSGLVITPESSATPSTATLTSVTAAGHVGSGIVVFADTMTATNLTATQNGSGMLLVANTQLIGTGLGATGNQGIGIAAGGAEVRLASSVAQENRTGFELVGDHVVIDDCTASTNGPAGVEPSDGAGFWVAVTELDASGNEANSNAIGWYFDDTEPLGRPAFLGAAGPFAWPPRAPGGVAPPQRLTLLSTVTAGNTAASMRVRLRDQGQLSVSCSDFIDNLPPGFDLLTSHTVDARANYWDSVSGPTHPLNPGGMGDAIRDGASGGSGTVQYAGFLDARASPEDCLTTSAIEVPALGPIGLGMLALALAVAAAVVLRLGR